MKQECLGSTLGIIHLLDPWLICLLGRYGGVRLGVQVRGKYCAGVLAWNNQCLQMLRKFGLAELIKEKREEIRRCTCAEVCTSPGWAGGQVWPHGLGPWRMWRNFRNECRMQLVSDYLAMAITISMQLLSFISSTQKARINASYTWMYSKEWRLLKKNSMVCGKCPECLYHRLMFWLRIHQLWIRKGNFEIQLT